MLQTSSLPTIYGVAAVAFFAIADIPTYAELVAPCPTEAPQPQTLYLLAGTRRDSVTHATNHKGYSGNDEDSSANRQGHDCSKIVPER
jgi:hypothetical protein